MKARPQTCRRKIRYTHALAALRALIDVAAAGRAYDSLGVYLCDCCGGYHLGNRRLTRSQCKRLAKLPDRPVMLRFIKRTNAAISE